MGSMLQTLCNIASHVINCQSKSGKNLLEAKAMTQADIMGVSLWKGNSRDGKN